MFDRAVRAEYGHSYPGQLEVNKLIATFTGAGLDSMSWLIIPNHRATDAMFYFTSMPQPMQSPHFNWDRNVPKDQFAVSFTFFFGSGFLLICSRQTWETQICRLLPLVKAVIRCRDAVYASPECRVSEEFLDVHLWSYFKWIRLGRQMFTEDPDIPDSAAQKLKPEAAIKAMHVWDFFHAEDPLSVPFHINLRTVDDFAKYELRKCISNRTTPPYARFDPLDEEEVRFLPATYVKFANSRISDRLQNYVLQEVRDRVRDLLSGCANLSKPIDDLGFSLVDLVQNPNTIPIKALRKVGLLFLYLS